MEFVAADDEGSTAAGFRDQWATLALVGLNVSVFLAMLLAGASPVLVGPAAVVEFGGVDPVRVWDGEVWRLFTANFVHLGFWHLGLNMWVLWQLGRALEQMIGGARVLLIYAASGVFGFATSLSLHSGPTAGASAAVFGVTGALLALALLVRHARFGRVLFAVLLPFIAGTFVLGFLIDGIDNTAHVGGLVFGFVLTYGLSAGDRAFLGEVDPNDHPVSPRESIVGTIALLVAGVLFAVTVVYAARPVLSPRYHAVAGLADLQSRRVDDAELHLARAKQLGRDDAATLFLEGRILDETAPPGDKGDVQRADARRILKEAVRRLREPDMGKAYIAVLQTLPLLGGDDPDVPYSDPKTVNAICDAMIEMLGQTPSPEVRNDCAWLKLKSPAVHDAVRGLALAQQAVADSGGKDGNIIQTLAEADAQNDNAAEGLALMQRLAAEDRGSELVGGSAFLDSELQRLKALADEQAKRTKDRVGSP